MRPASRAITAALLVTVLLPVGLRAQVPDAASRVLEDGRLRPTAPAVIARNEQGVTVRATRITTPLSIDGRLDESVYELVPGITEFVQQEPAEGAPVSESTTAWVMYDEENLYIACRCLMTDRTRIVANDMRRDSTNLRQNDNFGVFLDTFHDRRNGYLFYVSPAGGMFDGATANERINNADWNTVWDARVSHFPGGWSAEIVVPFKSLRYRPGRQQTWGINLRRTIRDRNEYAYIAPIAPEWGVGGFFRASAAATLIDLEVPAAAVNLEIKPYTASRLTTDNVARPAVRNDANLDAGLDVKYGVTSSATVDFTYNTDFAQVEVDEAQVNLTRFNLLFPEKREFFLEGQGIFSFGGAAGGGGGDSPTIFYSRRIGLQGAAAIPIAAGARLAGRTGRYSIGALNIQTLGHDQPAVEGTNFTVVRLRRDILQRSTIGVLFTNRTVSRVARGSNQVLGVDGTLAISPNLSISGYGAQSWTEDRTQDALSYRTNVNYSADRYGLQLDRTVVGDNFNPEVGFLRRSRFRSNFASVRFSPRPVRNTSIRQFVYEGSLDYVTDNHNRLESRSLTASARMDLQNSDALSVSYYREHELLRTAFEPADNITVPAGAYTFQGVRASWTQGQQHRLSGAMSVNLGEYYDGTRKTASLNARYSFTNQLGIEPNVSLNWIERLNTRATVAVVGARTTFTMTPRMFVGALMQYSSDNQSVASNFRFRWEYRPGSELFVVYSDTHSTSTLEGQPSLQNRGVVIKINRLFRF